MDNRLIFGQIEEIHPKLVQNERGDWLQWHCPGACLHDYIQRINEKVGQRTSPDPIAPIF